MDIEVRKIYRSSNVRGMTVKSPSKETIGKIEEVAIELGSGQIAYAVLSVGGFLGINNKLFAIPWEEFALTHDETEKYFVLDTSKEKLTAAPGFDKHDWPKAVERNWESEVEEHYQRAQRVRHLDQQLIDLDARIDQLKSKVTAAEGEREVELRTQLAEAQAKRDQADRRVNELKEAPIDSWHDAEADAQSALAEARNKVEAALHENETSEPHATREHASTHESV